MPILTLIKAIQKNEVQSIDDLLSSYNKEDLKVTDKAGNSLLHYLIKYGQTEMAEKLFNYYKEFSIAEFTALKNKQSENPLHWLIRYRRDIFVVIPKVFQPQVILAWINQPNAHGNTPLHLAVTLGNSVGIDQLLELGKQNIHINSRNFQGQTSLHIAAQKKYVCIAEALVKHKPDTTLVDNAGNTALHLAALNLNNSIFELLLKEGSSIAIKNRQQKTPIDLRIDAMKRQGKWRTFILVAIGTACPVATILTFSSLPFIAAIFNVPEYIMYIITALSLLSAFAVIWGKYEINVIKYGKSAQQSLQLQVRKISTETVLRECKELEADFKTEANYDDSTLINKVTQLSERLKLTLSNDYFDPYHFKKRQLMRNPADWATRRDKVCTLFSTIGSFFCGYSGILGISAFIEQANFINHLLSAIPTSIRLYTDLAYAILVGLGIFHFSSKKTYKNALLTFGAKHLAFYKAQQDLVVLYNEAQTAYKNLASHKQTNDVETSPPYNNIDLSNDDLLIFKTDQSVSNQNTAGSVSEINNSDHVVIDMHNNDASFWKNKTPITTASPSSSSYKPDQRITHHTNQKDDFAHQTQTNYPKEKKYVAVNIHSNDVSFWKNEIPVPTTSPSSSSHEPDRGILHQTSQQKN